VKPAVQEKKVLPFGHEKEQICVQTVFPYFGRKEPESIINHETRDKNYTVQMENNTEIHQLKLGKDVYKQEPKAQPDMKFIYFPELDYSDGVSIHSL